MAATCGVGLNSAMASGLNVLGDVHGGAGEQALALYEQVAARLDGGFAMGDAVREALAEQVRLHGKTIPGFGHRFHPVDPRSAPLLERVDEAAAAGQIGGRMAAIGRAIEDALAQGRPRRIPMNIDGATAVIYGELGFPAPLARGLFCLSRAVGLLAHAWEQTQQGGRIKGPLELRRAGAAPGAGFRRRLRRSRIACRAGVRQGIATVQPAQAGRVSRVLAAPPP